MRKLLLLIGFILSGFYLNAQIVISEIMYNDPSVADSLEFIELTNTGSSTVNLQNYSFGLGVSYTFPSLNIAPNGVVLVAKDSLAMLKYFNKTARQWSGALNNSGEAITLLDPAKNIVDEVDFSDSNGWPTEADGGGYSLNLCDLKSDNNVASNWSVSLNNSGAKVNGVNIYASPGSITACPGSPLLKFLGSSVVVNEGSVGLEVKIAKEGSSNLSQKVTVVVDPSSDAINNVDYSFSYPTILTFNSTSVTDTQTIFIALLDDAVIETNESVILNLINPVNLTLLPNSSSYHITITDNDIVSNDALVLTGVFDAQPNGIAGAKGVEVYALKDIPDMSIYGLGSANNGGGSDGIEFVFPAVAVAKGTYLHIAADSLMFHTYFGFNADYISSAVLINGNDAIELFENTGVIDVFGEIDVDGTGQPWEYLDGWAYRKNGTGPDGSTFVLDNWNFSGVSALDGPPTNSSAANPFPINTYKPIKDSNTKLLDDIASTDINSAVIINILSNDILPNGIKSIKVSNALHGTTLLANNKVVYTPNAGYCGTDNFSYVLTDNLNATDTAVVNITIKCAASYPIYTIAQVSKNNNLGVADSLDVYCQLQGIIYGNDFQGGTNIQFYMIDNTGGISVFSTESFGYTVKEGDEVIVRGRIDQFSGLTQMAPDTLWKVSSGNVLKSPAIVTTLDESTESEFVKFNLLSFKDKAQWTTGTGTGFNVDVVDGVGNTFSMRIDNDVDLFNMPAPAFTYFRLTGIGSQFDNSSPFTSGYQILPRYASDIEGLVSTFDPGLEELITISPNPASSYININSKVNIDKLTISDVLGNTLLIKSELGKGSSIDVTNYPKGMYLIKYEVSGKYWTSKFIRE